ncbi:MAG: universal stress protein [Pedobacter sp.]|nr:MAG: universal stress protein [Pedobacter sp.]
MKKIIVMADFSVFSNKALQYAIPLASKMGAEILLCHGVEPEMLTPMPNLLNWPSEALEKEVNIAQQTLIKYISETQASDYYKTHGSPLITPITELGGVKQILDNLIKEEKEAIMVVMGLAGKGTLDRFLLGSNSLDVIDDCALPVLLIPKEANFNPLNKIAFATDLSKSDIQTIHDLARLFCLYMPEILLTHVCEGEINPNMLPTNVSDFLNDITAKINYSKIYYRQIKEDDVLSGIKWITENGRIDMLAMIHRNSSIFSRIFKGSNTQKISSWIQLPLLVMPQVNAN